MGRDEDAQQKYKHFRFRHRLFPLVMDFGFRSLILSRVHPLIKRSEGF